jgi:Domain of unknown function (DUF4403)
MAKSLPKRPGLILIAIAVLAVSFLFSLKAMDWLSRGGALPTLAALPPLPPVSRSSFVVAPVAIALTAIRDAAERGAPRNFAGKANNPAAQVLQNADISWTASRGPIAATGSQDTLSLSTPLTGKLNVTGSLSAKATGAVGDAIGGILGANAAKQFGSINIKSLNASAEIKGNVIITARPRLGAAWRVEPNLGAQVNLGDTSLVAAGARVNVPAQVKPLIDKTVGEQLNLVAEKIRTDPTIERTARLQWAKACRSLPLQAASSSMPPLWLEFKPTRAIAAQPIVDAVAVTVTIGIEGETRITPAETRPDCPFPDKITIVPPTPGGVSIAVPIDLSFAELNTILEAQLVGRSFPEDGSGPVDVTVKHATVKAAGDRLLIALDVHAKEKKSFLGLGSDATVQIRGRPVIDPLQQTLRLAELELAVDSGGVVGAAAQVIIPRLQRAFTDKATVDLKPLAADAQKKLAAAIAEFQKSEDGIQVEAKISSINLADIAFDQTTLRVIAQAQGTLNARVTKLPEF